MSHASSKNHEAKELSVSEVYTWLQKKGLWEMIPIFYTDKIVSGNTISEAIRCGIPFLLHS